MPLVNILEAKSKTESQQASIDGAVFLRKDLREAILQVNEAATVKGGPHMTLGNYAQNHCIIQIVFLND